MSTLDDSCKAGRGFYRLTKNERLPTRQRLLFSTACGECGYPGRRTDAVLGGQSDSAILLGHPVELIAQQLDVFAIGLADEFDGAGVVIVSVVLV